MDLPEFRRNLKQLMGSYSLPSHVILDTVEASLALALASRYPDEQIRVGLNEETLEMTIVGYSGPYLTATRVIPESRLSGIKNLHTHIANGLAAVEVLRMSRKFKKFLHQIRAGTVTRILPGGDLAVAIHLEPNQEDPMTGICQAWNLPPHERGKIMVGDVRVFHIRRCNPIVIKGTPRLQLDLDRISKNIPMLMLKAYLFPSNPKVKVTCRHRKCGVVSELWTNTPVAKGVRQQVEKELKEKLFIVWGKTAEEVKENHKKIRNNRRRKATEGTSSQAG